MYTGWDYRYDIHILVQVLGRWFLLPLHVVHINHKYFQGLVRTPFYSLEPMSGINYDAPTLYVSEDGEEIYDPREVVGRAEELEIDPSKRIRHILGSERSIYNSLRYIRKQAKYGNTPDPSWIAKKIALLLDYLRLADNPQRLQKLQEEYWNKPLPEFLEYLRNYLASLARADSELICGVVYGSVNSDCTAIVDEFRGWWFSLPRDQCSVCGSQASEIDEDWRYYVEDDTGIAVLERLVPLCEKCHLAKHLGYASVHGRGREALEHLACVNGVDIEVARHAARRAFEVYSALSGVEKWKIVLKGVTGLPKTSWK